MAQHQRHRGAVALLEEQADRPPLPEAVGPHPVGGDAGVTQHRLGEAGELLRSQGCEEVVADAQLFEEPSSEEDEAVGRHAGCAQPGGQGRDGCGPRGEGLWPGAPPRPEGPGEPIPEVGERLRGERKQALHAKLGVAEQGGGPGPFAGKRGRLPRPTRVRLGPEYRDVDDIAEEQRVAELTLLEVIEAQRAVVQDGHVRRGGRPRALAAGRWPAPPSGSGVPQPGRLWRRYDGNLLAEDGPRATALGPLAAQGAGPHRPHEGMLPGGGDAGDGAERRDGVAASFRLREAGRAFPALHEELGEDHGVRREPR